MQSHLQTIETPFITAIYADSKILMVKISKNSSELIRGFRGEESILLFSENNIGESFNLKLFRWSMVKAPNYWLPRGKLVAL